MPLAAAPAASKRRREVDHDAQAEATAALRQKCSASEPGSANEAYANANAPADDDLGDDVGDVTGEGFEAVPRAGPCHEGTISPHPPSEVTMVNEDHRMDTVMSLEHSTAPPGAADKPIDLTDEADEPKVRVQSEPESPQLEQRAPAPTDPPPSSPDVGPPAIFTWLESVKPGFGERFSAAFIEYSFTPQTHRSVADVKADLRFIDEHELSRTLSWIRTHTANRHAWSFLFCLCLYWGTAYCSCSLTHRTLSQANWSPS